MKETITKEIKKSGKCDDYHDLRWSYNKAHWICFDCERLFKEAHY